ncbi:hypothetical protein [Pseudomonas parakoreensis]|uniref:hypothetical protein n=1 Tax=Pseudomonas parakoreensis TaxID=2892331 RepID=UPI003FD20779
MSSDQQYLEAFHIGEKGEATGVIKGEVKNLHTEVTFDFLSTWIWRDEQNETLRFHGTMPDPLVPGRTWLVALGLSDKSQPSGTFPVGDSRIVYLNLVTFGIGEPTRTFEASSGYIVLEHHSNNDINGKLVFQTKQQAFDSFDVNVTFAIGQF